jgi:outer membrane lipoprotein LolB
MRSRLAHGGLPGLLWAVAVVAGCRTVPVQPPPSAGSQAWDVTRSELQARDHFELKGRVAVAAGKDGFNAALRWTQNGTLSHVSLAGPLGAGGVEIAADGGHLGIVTSNGEHLDSDAARGELEQRLGFDPPLGSLRYWVLGVPDPATPAKETVDPQQQRLQSLQQNGWQIDYGGYMSSGIGPSGIGSSGNGPVGAGPAGEGAGASLPSRLTVQRSGVRVRLIVDGWSLQK